MNKDSMRYIAIVAFAAANDKTREITNDLDKEKAAGSFSPLELATIDFLISMFSNISEEDGALIVASYVAALSYINEPSKPINFVNET